MGRNNGLTEYTDVLRYSKSKGKRVPVRNCEIVTNFLYNKTDFYLLRWNGVYIVSTPNKGELILLTYSSVMDGKYEKTPGEAVAEFRKGYAKNGVTNDRIMSFIDDPMKYYETYRKSRSK